MTYPGSLVIEMSGRNERRRERSRRCTMENLHMKGVRVRTLRGTWGVGSVEEDPNVSNSRLSIVNIECT